MNKNDFLKDLENNLKELNIENPYTILRDTDLQIEKLVMEGKAMDDALKEVGPISKIIEQLVNEGEYKQKQQTYDNDDNVYENCEDINSSKNNNEQFSESFLFKNTKQFSEPNPLGNSVLKIILYCLLVLIIISFFFKILFIGTPFLGFGLFSFYGKNIFSFISTLAIILLVIYFISKQKK